MFFCRSRNWPILLNGEKKPSQNVSCHSIVKWAHNSATFKGKRAEIRSYCNQGNIIFSVIATGGATVANSRVILSGLACVSRCLSRPINVSLSVVVARSHASCPGKVSFFLEKVSMCRQNATHSWSRSWSCCHSNRCKFHVQRAHLLCYNDDCSYYLQKH